MGNMKFQSIEAKLKGIDRERDRLSRSLETSKAKFFAAIPGKYGYRSIDALITALAPYASLGLRSRIDGENSGTATTRTTRATKRTSAKKGVPRRYTEQQKAAVKAAVQKGDKTVAEIAKQHRVAVYSIIDWKKKWGLVKHRKKASREGSA
jgi:hypothetical protein